MTRPSHARKLPVAALACAVALGAALSCALPRPAAASTTTPTVVIDAGHQARANLRLEPIGPGSRVRKPKVSGGTSGVVTRRRESLVNLRVALRLRALLEQRGVKVIMIRTSERVNIANSRRAATANAAHADLFIRLHCDSAGRSRKGVLTLVPKRNRWTGPIAEDSRRAGRDIHAAVLASTGARNRGIARRSDMAGFNWSKVPCTIVEMGVMSNPAEDRRLSSATYQQRLAGGIADGTMRYLSGQ